MDNRDLETGDEIREDNSSDAAAATGNSAGERMVADSRRRRRRRPRPNGPRTAGGYSAYFSFVALLIGLIPVNKYPNKNDSHLTSMNIPLVAICIYGLAVAFKHNVRGLPRKYSQIVNKGVLIMGLLLPVSLVSSAFIPNWLGWIPYFIWVIFSVVVAAWDWFLHIIHWLYQTTKNAMLKVFTSFWEYLVG